MIKLPLSCENKREGLLSDCRVGVKQIESEDYSSWIHWQYAWKLTSEQWYESETVWQGRLQVTVGQQGVCWLQVRCWHDRSYIPLLPHDLTVKLSPCPCSHSSLAGWMAACLWAFQMKFVTHSGSPQNDSASYLVHRSCLGSCWHCHL